MRRRAEVRSPTIRPSLGRRVIVLSLLAETSGAAVPSTEPIMPPGQQPHNRPCHCSADLGGSREVSPERESCCLDAIFMI